MPSLTTENDCPKIGTTTFFAKLYPGETCGSNGLPITPNSISILGRAQKLKVIEHPNLSVYLDIIRGKHERIIVVSEYIGKPLSDVHGLDIEEKIRISKQIAHGLCELHNRGIVHRNISADNILVDMEKNVKLFNYGLFYMTNEGKDVAFPIGQPRYLSPEAILGGGGAAGDVWNYGIIILELLIGPLWAGLKPGPVLRRIMTLLQTSNPAQRIAREHDASEIYQNLPQDLRSLIELCLCISPKGRPTMRDVLSHPLFSDSQVVPLEQRSHGLLGCRMQLLYHWWQLAGGDIYIELKKQGLIKCHPPILSMPICVLLDGSTLGGRASVLMDRRVGISTLNLLLSRLSHVSPLDFVPLVESPPALRSDSSLLPRIIKERDTEYQFHRLILFERLLRGYPYTAARIKREAKIDIPPLVRGEVWSALLDVRGDIEDQYIRIDKENPTPTDRQIEVDIPRCHQYCWLLCGSAGHLGLRRILKAWLITHPQYVYWQGLDSLTAPFLYLNFNNQARAFACLSAFVPRYLHNFFLKDNSAIIKEYLAKFWQLTAFHEPKLSCHLHQINFVPELFAIPWFLTMFSHVFPLHKILHLWDALLVEDDSLALYMGVAILRQLRDTLLSSGFNECILLFSDLPEVDIEQCVYEAMKMHQSSPRSIAYRSFSNRSNTDRLDTIDIDSKTLQLEVCPRISCKDLVELIHKNAVCIVDLRPNLQFSRCNVPNSVNVAYNSVELGNHCLEALGDMAEGQIRTAHREGNTVVILSTEDDTAQLFSDFLLKCEVGRVCILHGGVNILHSVTPPVLQTHHIPIFSP